MPVTSWAAALVTTALVTSPARLSPGDGSTSMPDQVLRKGCRSYTYSYSLSPTTGDWQAEMFLLDPDRERVAAGALDSDIEDKVGQAAFWVCRGTTRFGQFKIRGRLTTYDGWQQSSTWIAPSYVRLHRWGR